MSVAWNERKDAACPRGVGIATDVYASHAQGTELFDENGKRYIDFAGGIGVLNVGHRHPRVEAAVVDQARRFMHSCYQVLPYKEYITLAERLNAMVPGDFPKKTVFFTTGVEAVENAIKIARAATGRPAIISFNGAFHGRTMMGLALTGKVAPYKIGFGSLPGDVYRAPFPADGTGAAVADTMAAIQDLFRYDVEASRVAAIIIEPVQGEGGFYPAPVSLMRQLRALCDAHGILLIADEIQCGVGRTGTMFAMEHFGVAADITTVAKSLAGGMPLSGVVGRASVMDAPAPGGLGSTYAGAPLAIAAAHAVLDVFEKEALLEHGNLLARTMRQRLARAQERHTEITDVRGLGPMIAMEFSDEHGKPSAALAQALRMEALDAGLILLTCGSYGNAIRFLFPLNTPVGIFNEALDILDTALANVLRREHTA
ncbi:4-aminobutyrate--2-oxoglutarate transaminase [Pigmentiphaga litoralis]|uniref:4-aminobutyrate aminotransferase n=1 Tax=Pigmentiphaga litoralis TaxID=516702 RepID=A0A7Y9IW41_9BURK|nr:4-aminobutyrate aminotransferase [Pigmentiphaga litoralis]NYE84162.1 4-aminobutyrate aminotransferase [Pigmentiphaga litoralis]